MNIRNENWHTPVHDSVLVEVESEFLAKGVRVLVTRPVSAWHLQMDIRNKINTLYTVKLGYQNHCYNEQKNVPIFGRSQHYQMNVHGYNKVTDTLKKEIDGPVMAVLAHFVCIDVSCLKEVMDPINLIEFSE